LFLSVCARLSQKKQFSKLAAVALHNMNLPLFLRLVSFPPIRDLIPAAPEDRYPKKVDAFFLYVIAL